MKKQLISTAIILCMILTIIPTPVFAAGASKTLYCGPYTLEISDAYGLNTATGSAADGFTIVYFVAVPNGATVKIKKLDASKEYNLRPFNDITFSDTAKHPDVEFACDYDDSIYVETTVGSTIALVKNNEYSFYDTETYGDNDRKNYLVRIFVVEDEKLVKFGGAKPKPKPASPSGNILATPSKTQFLVKGKSSSPWYEAPLVVTQAYSINQTNYLQLRAIATMLNRTVSQFDIGWDGQYAVIEPGKAFSGTVIGAKMQDTRDVRTSGTKFKMNGEVFSFKDAKMVNGDINYIQLREFAQKLSGTASQFNIYWDERIKQAVIQPGLPYTGTKYTAPVTVLEEYNSDTDILADGDYYLRIFDKFIYPVTGGKYWLELKDNIPNKPYSIKLVENDKEKGSKYTITYDGTYIVLPYAAEKQQLQTNDSVNPHYWRINTYPKSKFTTIRDYKNQKMIVNASGNSNSNGTLVIVWESTGSAPNNAKISLFKDAVSNGLKTLMYIKETPVKTAYKLGEAFDTSGIDVVINEAGVDRNINDEITFYTSGTVELTQGRPFTTTGKKVIEIKYKGIKYGEYTIEVSKNNQ